MNPHNDPLLPLNCPLCPHIILHNYEETGVHLSITHHLCYSAHILANTMWMGSMGYKQVGDILRDVGNMNQVLWNMKKNVDEMKKQLNRSETLGIKMEFDIFEKSCQTEFSDEDKKCTESKDMRESSFDDKFKEELAEISKDGRVDEEIIEAKSAEVRSDVREECFSPTTSCISHLGDELEIVKKLSLEKYEQLDKLKEQVIEQHVQIRSLGRRIRMFESRSNNSIKLVEVIRRTGQRVAKIVKDEFKVFEEEVVEEVGDLNLPNSNNNVEAQTDYLRDKVITSQDCVSGCAARMGVKRSARQDRSCDEQGNQGKGNLSYKIRRIDN